MTAMLKPPVQMVRDLGWRQVLGPDQADDGFWAEVRGQQLAQLARNVPFNLSLLTVNLVAVLAVFGRSVPFTGLAPWLCGIAVLAGLWSLRIVRRRPQPGRRRAGRLEFWRVTAEIGALATFWAGMVHALAPSQSAEGQSVLLLFSLVGLGAVTSAAATMPVAVLPDGSGDRAEKLAQRIVKDMARPFPLGDEGRAGAAVVGASVGWALAPFDADTPEDLLRCADLALYRVKEQGRGAACRFAPEMAQAVAERRKLEADLAAALDRGQLRLLFQPVVDSEDERITGFEALLRWHHPELGVVSPLDFVPVAEETGLIVPIGAWVIDEALAWATRWPPHVKVSVNLSAVQVEEASLPDVIAAALARHQIGPERLELEITESLFLAEKPAVIEVLARLTAMGVSFALDDFGTGYSALGTLQKASFSRIKIDRSFVARASAMGDEASAIIQAIVRLAASLDMQTTAEGTETRAAFELCRQLGCTQVQGYLFGKPMPPEEATRLVCEAVGA